MSAHSEIIKAVCWSQSVSPNLVQCFDKVVQVEIGGCVVKFSVHKGELVALKIKKRHYLSLI